MKRANSASPSPVDANNLGGTLGLAYTVFNLLGLDEFLSTQIDGGPESLQLAIGLAKEGFLGSRGTLALSVFDTFLRPRLTPGVQGPFPALAD